MSSHRSDMRKPLYAMVLAIAALIVMVMPAVAGREWCAKDPIVALNGQEVQIFAAVPENMQIAVTGPINVLIKSPAGVTEAVLFTDSGFNGYGETVVFGNTTGVVAPNGSFEAQIRVTIPVDTNLLLAANIPVTGPTIPMQVTIVTGGTTTVVEGQSSGLNKRVIVAGS